MKLTEPRRYAVHHLLTAKNAAARVGLSTKMFLVAVQAGQLGPVELMYIGRQKFVRASALADFLEGKSDAAAPADRDLFASAPSNGGA